MRRWLKLVLGTTQLAAFKNRGFEVLGIEPSSALANMARGRGIDTRVIVLLPIDG